MPPDNSTNLILSHLVLNLVKSRSQVDGWSFVAVTTTSATGGQSNGGESAQSGQCKVSTVDVDGFECHKNSLA